MLNSSFVRLWNGAVILLNDDDHLDNISKDILSQPTTNIYQYATSIDYIRDRNEKEAKVSGKDMRTLYIVFAITRTGGASLKDHLKSNKNDAVYLDQDHYTFVDFSECFETNDDDFEYDAFGSLLGNPKIPLNSTIFQYCLEAIPSKNNAITVLDYLRLHAVSDDKDHWREFHEIFNSIGWNVVAIVPYRRFYEWLPSYMEVIYGFLQDAETWDKGIYLPYGGFDEFQRYIRRKGSVYSKNWGASAEEVHPTEAVANRLSKYFKDVGIFNIHADENDATKHNRAKENDVLVSFYCYFLKAQSICKEREGKGSLRHYRSTTFNYDIFADAMHNEYGVIPETLSPKLVITAIRNAQYFMSKGVYDFPMKCPSSEVYEWIWEMSLQYENRILPMQDLYARELHKTNFKIALKGHKYCIIDVSKLVVNEDWRSYLSTRTRKNLHSGWGKNEGPG